MKNKYIYFSIIVSAVAFLMPASFVHADYEISDGSVQAYFPLHANSTDITGNHNGVDTSMTYTGSGCAFGTGCASFNGTNSFIRGLNPTSSVPTGDFTISYWEYTSSTAFQTLVELGSSSTYKAVRTWENNPTNGASLVDVVGINIMQSSAKSLSNWHSVVLSKYNSSTIGTDVYNIWIDGVLDSSGTTPLATNMIPGAFNIGFTNIGSGYYFSGRMEGLAILNKAVTSSYATAIWNTGVGQDICVTPGCGNGGGGGGGLTGSIKFHFPLNNTSTAIPDFDTYQFDLSNLPTSTFGQYNIIVGANELSGSVINGNYLDYGTFYNTGSATDTTIVSKQLQNVLESIDNTTSTWQLSVTLQTGANILSADNIQILVNANAPIPTTSSTFQIGFHPLPLPSSTVASYCGLGILGSSGSITGCITQGIDYFIGIFTTKLNFLTRSAVSSSIMLAENTLPFSIPFDAYTALNQASTTLASTSNPVISYTFPAYITGFSTTTRTIVLVSPSSSFALVSQDANNQWFDFQSLILDVLFIGVIIIQTRETA